VNAKTLANFKFSPTDPLFVYFPVKTTVLTVGEAATSQPLNTVLDLLFAQKGKAYVHFRQLSQRCSVRRP
jgi:hypothetical protein